MKKNVLGVDSGLSKLILKKIKKIDLLTPNARK